MTDAASTDAAKTATAGIPPGFRPIAFKDATFNASIGPVHARYVGEELVLGFRVEPRHCNPAGIVHGGMLMTIADMTAGFCAAFGSGIDKFMPTVNMTFDFISSGAVGDWVEGRGELLKTTRSLAFATVMLSVGERPVLRASCIMKIPSGEGFHFDRSRIIG